MVYENFDFYRSKIKKFALIGNNAHPAVISGGGSAFNKTDCSMSILDGIKNFVGDDVEVLYSRGSNPIREIECFNNSLFSTEDGKKGLKAEYFNNLELNDEPVHTTVHEFINFEWGAEKPIEQLDTVMYSVRWAGIFFIYLIMILSPKFGLMMSRFLIPGIRL